MNKVRIIALYIQHRDGVSDEDRRRLYQHARLTMHEQDAVNSLAHLGVRISRVRHSFFLWHDGCSVSPIKGGRSSIEAACTSFRMMLHPLLELLSMTFAEGDSLESSFQTLATSSWVGLRFRSLDLCAHLPTFQQLVFMIGTATRR